MAKHTSKKQKKGNEKPGFLKRLRSFFRSLLQELKKVSWTDGKTLRQNTATVLVIIFIAAFTIWLFDLTIQTVLTGVGFYKTKNAAPPAVAAPVEPVVESPTEAPAE